MKAALDVLAIVFNFVFIYFLSFSFTIFFLFVSFSVVLFLFDYFIHLLELYLNVMDLSGVAPDCIIS